MSKDDIKAVSGGMKNSIDSKDQVPVAVSWSRDEPSVVWNGILINTSEYKRLKSKGRPALDTTCCGSTQRPDNAPDVY